MSPDVVSVPTIRSALANSNSDLPPRELQLLLAHVLNQSREWVLAHPEAELTPEQHERFENLVAQAGRGVPLPYLLGHWEFFGLDFIVTPAVLIPRPETELLVERALTLVKEQSSISNHAAAQASTILDVGTGSGIIAVTLAAKLPNAQVVAIDLSPSALAVAKQNADQHGVADRIQFIKSDLLSAFVLHPSSFSLICANLPYIPSADLATLDVAKHEPTLALDGGADGLSLIRRLLIDAPQVLALGGSLLLEIEYRQGEAVTALAREAFPTAIITVHKDLAGLNRVVEISAIPPLKIAP